MDLYRLRRKLQVKKKNYGMEKGIHLLRRYKKGIIDRYISIAPIDIRVNTFCHYLIDTYIDENANFLSYLWSSFNISGE
jgi:hypothetical protein